MKQSNKYNDMKISNKPENFGLLQSKCELIGLNILVQYKIVDKVFNGMNFGKKSVYSKSFLTAPKSLINEVSDIFNVVFKSDVSCNYEDGSVIYILTAKCESIEITLV
jgi:hypothetical protein